MPSSLSTNHRSRFTSALHASNRPRRTALLLLDHAATTRSVFLAVLLVSLAGLATARDGLTPQLDGEDRRRYIAGCTDGAASPSRGEVKSSAAASVRRGP